MLTHARLLEVVTYDPETGDFTWKVRAVRRPHDATWNTKWAGRRAGSRQSVGYWQITIDDEHFLAHRVAWLYMTGSWPVDQIDHKDMNRTNNRWANLREATNGQNAANRTVQSNCGSGYRGVKLHKASGLWHARITHEGKTFSLGYHHSPEEAAARYAAKAAELRGEFHRL